MKDVIRVLELRSVFGTGGGPEKTILLGAARTDRERFAITVCYLRSATDELFGIGERAKALGVDYVEIRERGSFDPRIWTELRQLIRDRNIQIVHAHEYKTDFLAWLLAKVEPITPLATVHGWTGHSNTERRLYYPADKLLLRQFPQAVCVSSEIRSELLKWGCDPSRVPVLLNGIDHRAFRRDPARQAAARVTFGFGPDDIVIGSVGRLEPQKRFDLLIEAFGDLLRTHPRIRLAIAGEGSSRAELEAQIRAAGLDEHCRLLGHVTNVVDLHHALDMFVQSSAYEGTPNVVLEAMALETPVVATSAGGTAELVRQGIDGIIVPSGSVEQLRTAMAEALNDPAKTEARRRSARQRVEGELSFESRMASLERIYEQLIHDAAGNTGAAQRMRQSA